MVDWNSFRETVRATHTDWFDLPTVTVYNYSGGYDPTTGDTNWTRDSGTDVIAEVVEDQPSVTADPDGLNTEDGDADIHVRDDIAVPIHPVGTDGQKPTEIVYDGTTYKVADKTNEQNGLLLLVCVEAL